MPDLGEIAVPVAAAVVLLQAVVWAVVKLRSRNGSSSAPPPELDWARLAEYIDSQIEKQPATQRDLQDVGAEVAAMRHSLDEHTESQKLEIAALQAKLTEHMEEDRRNFAHITAILDGAA